MHQRVYDTLRGSPIFEVQNVLTGDPKAGEAYSTAKESATRAIRRPVTSLESERGMTLRLCNNDSSFPALAARARAAARQTAKPVTVSVTRHPARQSPVCWSTWMTSTSHCGIPRVSITPGSESPV